MELGDLWFLVDYRVNYEEIVNEKTKVRISNKVKNFWIKTPAGIIKNEKRPLNPNLDSIPFPDRKMFDNYEEVRIAKVHSFIASIILWRVAGF